MSVHGEPPGLGGDGAGPPAGDGAPPHQRLAARALAVGDPTGWFEPLYAAAERGMATVPWDRGTPHWLLAEWLDGQPPGGPGPRAVVVGCGLGHDAELLAGRGLRTVAFDISASAIRGAKRRHPGSVVDYQVADLLSLPPAWRGGFDLVVESQTIQALPDPPRSEAIKRIAGLVAPGGTLLVLALAREDREDPGEWPPWPIARAEIDGFARAGLSPARIEIVGAGGRLPPGRRWLAEFRRPG